MADTMTSTATTLDIPVLPDRHIQYEWLAPAGRSHVAHLVVASEPTPRDHGDPDHDKVDSLCRYAMTLTHRRRAVTAHGIRARRQDR